jgi:hypothetical protein
VFWIVEHGEHELNLWRRVNSTAGSGHQHLRSRTVSYSMILARALRKKPPSMSPSAYHRYKRLGFIERPAASRSRRTFDTGSCGLGAGQLEDSLDAEAGLSPANHRARLSPKLFLNPRPAARFGAYRRLRFLLFGLLRLAAASLLSLRHDCLSSLGSTHPPLFFGASV